MKIIITGACAVSARSVLRSLKVSEKFKNAEFVGWDIGTTMYGLYENLYDKIYKVPAVSDVSYRSVIQSILDLEKPDAVIIVPEVEVLYWAEDPFAIPHIVPPKNFCQTVISKKKLFEVLENTKLIPKSIQLHKIQIFEDLFQNPLGYPVWIRDSAAGTASGKGSFKANSYDELKAWVQINQGIDEFQLSQYLPGGNYGCFCLFHHGKLKKMAQAERLEYLMAKVAISGITGNTCKGRLLNNEKIRLNALKAIDIICQHTNDVMEGLVVVDMKADDNGEPLITEINIRHVAYSSSFANAGFNLSEFQLLLILSRESELTEEIEMIYPTGNIILRDVDGIPIYLENTQSLQIGDCIINKRK